MLWRVSQAVWKDLIVTCALPLLAKPIRRPVMTPFQPGSRSTRIIVRASPVFAGSESAGGVK